MPRGVRLALFGLLFSILSCAPSGLNQRPGEGSQAANQETSYLESENLSASTDGEMNLLASSAAPEDSLVNGASSVDMLAKGRGGDNPEEEPYTDQKRIDDALYYYQEALESWNSGEPDKAIESLDQTYQIICSIQNEEDPEITQQKEDLRLLISKRILEIYASRSHPQMGHSREIPLPMNEYVEREIKRFQTSEKDFFNQAYRLSGRYRPYIVEEMKKAGLPENLSWLRPRTTSRH